ncbi:MAG: Lrp/AsnC ligand binding domain-containing protein [Pseudomonadota bacterium]
MVTAIILVNTQHGAINDVAQKLADIPGVSEVYSTGGQYDIVAVIRVASNEAIADLVTDHMTKIEGIAHTETMIAFKSYSQHDLEAVFSIGND